MTLRAQEAASVLQSLLEAERNFARLAVEKGTREAFLANLADDAVMFDPAPVNGKELYLKKPPSNSQLIWEPTYADVAREGDIGYTTGPWEFKKNASDPKPSAYGQFFTIWKKPPGGTWKVVLDGGIETPMPIGNTSPSETPEGRSLNDRKIDLKTARRALATAEREFNEAAAKNVGSAIISDASDQIRVFRNGRFPAVDRDAARLMLGYDHGRMTTKRLGSGISRSGDLAYFYGTYSTERLDGVEHGSFVTIWKMTVIGDWRLAVDVRKREQSPETKPKPAQ